MVFSENRFALFQPELRENKEMGDFRDSEKSKNALMAVALDQASRDQAPAVDKHEEDQLER